MKHTIQTGFKPYRPAPTPPQTRSTGDTARLLQSLKDSIEEFVFMGIQEFLTNKGFKRTLVAFQNEQQTITSVRPSDESWYKVSEYIDLVNIRESTRRQGESAYGTVFESMVLFLKQAHEAKLNRAKAAPVAPDPTDTVEEAGDPRISSNPLKDCDPVFLYAEQQKARLALEAAELERARAAAQTESPKSASVHEGGSPSHGMTAAQRKRKQRRARARARTMQQVGSVDQLTARLLKSQSRRSPKASRHAHTAKPKQRAQTSSFPMLSLSSQRPRKSRTAGGRRHLLSSTDMMDEMSMLERAGEGKYGPSEEKWIPLDSRLRMLKREMDAFKRNNDRDTRRLEDLHKAQPRTAELERAKTLERYSGKKKKRCSLCEQTYALVNLPLTISYKAVLDLRSSWGVDVEKLEPNPNMARFPHYYNEVRVCTFCAQFFDKESSYRQLEDSKPPQPSAGEDSGAAQA